MTTTRQRLAGLDGVRGLAALFVVVNHIFERAFPGYPADRAPFWAARFIYGRFAVVVFIVLSGFSLALAPARHGWRLDGVSGSRAAAPGGSCRRTSRRWSSASRWPGSASRRRATRAGAKSVLVNGLLVENLVRAPTPNRSFWSLAVEAQLYLVFPLLMLALRRLGPGVMLAGVTLLVARSGSSASTTWTSRRSSRRPTSPRCSRSAS